MSGVIIARRLLTDSAPVVAVVPVGRIISGVIPQGTALPAIGITEISGTDRNTLAPAAQVMVTQRVQITCMAKGYVPLKELIQLVRRACRNRIGTVGAFARVTCRLDGRGPDFADPAAEICMQSQDVLITFHESA